MTGRPFQKNEVDRFGFEADRRFDRCETEAEAFAAFATMCREVETLFAEPVEGDDLRRRHAFRMTMRGAFHARLAEQRAKNARRGDHAAA